MVKTTISLAVEQMELEKGVCRDEFSTIRLPQGNLEPGSWDASRVLLL